MKTIIIFMALFLAISTCQAYTAEQQAMIDGTSLSWKMAIAYDQQNIPEFNALADQWNAWVRQHFGEDASLIMKKMTGPVDLQKPYILANNTTSGVVHAIDGSTVNGPSYTTNDVNLLPDSVRYNATTKSYAGYQGDFLGGI